MYSIYKHTLPNGKVYIGQTKLQPEKRWQKGNGYSNQLHFYRDIIKYGWDNIQHEILIEVETHSEALRKEREYILEFHSNEPEFGYNKNSNWSVVGETEYRQHCKETYHYSKSTGYKQQYDGVICIEIGKTFKTYAEASRELKIDSSSIRKAATGQRKTAGGYHWKQVS